MNQYPKEETETVYKPLALLMHRKLQPKIKLNAFLYPQYWENQKSDNGRG